jgi:hypothetical protein
MPDFVLAGHTAEKSVELIVNPRFFIVREHTTDKRRVAFTVVESEIIKFNVTQKFLQHSSVAKMIITESTQHQIN